MPDSDKRSVPSDDELRQRAQARITMTRAAARRSNWRTAGYTAAVVACLFFMTLGTVFGHFYWKSAVFRDLFNKNGAAVAWNTIAHLDPTLSWTPEQKFPGRTSLNILVLGVDRDWDDRGRMVKGGARSDSILVAHVDFVNKTVGALTIPRDSAVHIPGRRGIHKINAAHAFGGPQLAMETIQSVFGIQPDACVVLNIDGFQKIVDAMGGIDLTVRKKLDYDDNWGHLHIHLKPGFQHLTGYQAMGYVRMRHSDSDFMRSQRQHEFLEAMREKIKQPATFVKLPDVINKLNDQVTCVNLDRDQLFTLMNFARQLPQQQIAVETLPSFEGPSYVTIDAEKSAQVIERLFFPNQMVALNVDAPDPNSVRSMNAPYERGSRRHSRRHRVRSSETRTRRSESTESESAPSSQDAPPSESGGSGGGAGDSVQPSGSPDGAGSGGAG